MFERSFFSGKKWSNFMNMDVVYSLVFLLITIIATFLSMFDTLGGRLILRYLTLSYLIRYYFTLWIN